MSDGPVGIVVAVATEFAPLRAEMSEVSVRLLGGVEYHEGRLGAVPVVLALCGVGRANAAAVVAVLCANFKPRCIINSGSAGGLDSKLKIGDVVIGQKLVYGDVDNRCFNYKFGQVPYMPPEFQCAQDLVDKFQEVSTTHSENFGIKIYSGRIVTVESFVATEEAKDTLLKHFPDAMAVEMEGCAVGHVCEAFKIPALVVRSISDTANDHQDYDEFAPLAGIRSAKVTQSLLSII